jgi:hypothetical protein
VPAYANPNSAGLPSDLGDYFYNFGNTDAGFWKFLANRGLSGGDIRSKFAQGQQSRYFNTYQSQLGDNPGLGYYDFLQNQANPDADFAKASDLEKGYAPSNIMAPRARWIIR